METELGGSIFNLFPATSTFHDLEFVPKLEIRTHVGSEITAVYLSLTRIIHEKLDLVGRGLLRLWPRSRAYFLVDLLDQFFHPSP